MYLNTIQDNKNIFTIILKRMYHIHTFYIFDVNKIKKSIYIIELAFYRDSPFIYFSLTVYFIYKKMRAVWSLVLLTSGAAFALSTSKFAEDVTQNVLETNNVNL